MLNKVLRRGDACPVPTAAEQALLEREGWAFHHAAGRTIPIPDSPIGVPLADLRARFADQLDPALPLDSDEEHAALSQLLGARGSGLGVLPQASLDGLLLSRNEKANGDRRVDFLMETAPGSWQALEVDGSQHATAASVDASRDADLRRIGIGVTRIAAGSAMDWTPDTSLTQGVQIVDSTNPLVHGPMAMDALVAGLVEGMWRGFLGGGNWCIDLHDSSGLGLVGFPAYLDLMSAIDSLWAGDVAPDHVTFLTDDAPLSFTRDGMTWIGASTHLDEVDMRLYVEVLNSPLHVLPAIDLVPAVVVRSARVPVAMLGETREPSVRVPTNLADSDVRRALRVVLRAVFGIEDFREGQLEAVTEILAGRDCVVLLPTGAGKSLVYQLAGLVLPGRTLVIDPIVALMEDQIRGLAENGIDRAVGISGLTTATGRTASALEEVKSGDALFVFIAPERLQQQSFRDALRSLSQISPINVVAIDEAHCVSEWGHDFRPAYLNLGNVARELCADSAGAAPPLLALTGTASRAVLRDVLAELDIVERGPNTLVRPASFDRPELRYSVVKGKPATTLATLEGVIRGMPARFDIPPDEFFAPQGVDTQSGLVFCPHANGDYGVISVAERLSGVTGMPVRAYAGSAPKGMQGSDWESIKRQNAADFIENRTPILVSTKAFGMGIDKANVRYVVHLGIPGSIESFYQEVGRAGRDRRHAETVLVFTEASEASVRSKLDDSVDLEVARGTRSSRSSSDDVDRQMFFHLNSFAGRAAEVSMMSGVVAEIEPSGAATTIELSPIDPQRERAIHRLLLLGVVSDYRVDWGGGRYEVDLGDVEAADVRRRLLDFVGRSQAARVDAFRIQLDPVELGTLGEEIDRCAELLVGFVYDTIEKSRRRSLREMWLAARESDDDAAMRRRILSYLTEGDLTPALVSLAESRQFAYEPWLDLIRDHPSLSEAMEMRGSAARLLSSYPEHPGLLAVRGIGELVDAGGDVDEAVQALKASAVAALGAYAHSRADVESAFTRMVEWLSGRALVEQAGLVSAVGADALPGWTPSGTGWERSASGSVVALARIAQDLVNLLDDVAEEGALA